jgi:sarcosine oxidase
VAVVGAGIVGLATAYELTLAGAAVTVYERGTPGAGQSGGESRIFRHGHDEPELVALAVESRARWRVWEERFGIELVAPVGSLLLGPAVERRHALLREAGVRARLVDAASVLPILAPRGAPGLLDEDGGVIRARAAIAALAAAVPIVADEVVEVRPSGEVRAGGAIASYDRVIVCAGRDTTAFVDLPVQVSTHTRFTYRVRAPGPPLPCLQDGGAGAYGDPLPGDDRYAIGLDGTDATHAYVAEHLPGLDPEPVEARTCWVTELPAGPDAFAVRQAGAATYVAGNNLFKHAPALGHRLANGKGGQTP